MMRGWESVAAIFRGRVLDRELDDELAAHVEMATADFQAQGMSEGEARRAALAALGGMAGARETHREARRLPFMETLLQRTFGTGCGRSGGTRGWRCSRC